MTRPLCCTALKQPTQTTLPIPLPPGWTLDELVSLSRQIPCPLLGWAETLRRATLLTTDPDIAHGDTRRAAAWVALLQVARCIGSITITVNADGSFSFSGGSNYVPGIGFAWDVFFTYFNQFTGYYGGY